MLPVAVWQALWQIIRGAGVEVTEKYGFKRRKNNTRQQIYQKVSHTKWEEIMATHFEMGICVLSRKSSILAHLVF